MGGKTGISWTDSTWNPLRGCTRVSDGCVNCYAEVVAHRFSGPLQPYEGLTDPKGRWNGTIKLVPEALSQPIRWKRDRLIFVNSMSDLFHVNVPFEYIATVFGVMASAPKHIFQVLTKRPERMLEFFDWVEDQNVDCSEYAKARGIPGVLPVTVWPLPNVWVGISAEDQETAESRIPLLIRTPAAVRWVSAEPLLGPLDVSKWLLHKWECPDCGDTHLSKDSSLIGPKIRYCGNCAGDSGKDIEIKRLGPALDWVVLGGESGSKARPFQLDWIDPLIKQCKEADVPLYIKQLGERPYASGFRVILGDKKGGNPEEWLPNWRVREWPGFKNPLPRAL